MTDSDTDMTNESDVETGPETSQEAGPEIDVEADVEANVEADGETDAEEGDETDAPEVPLYTAAQIETGRLLFARDITFMLSVVQLETLPPPDMPEVCFAGRSNVGKSSLINAITGRKDLARASNTPGRTRELNYFNVDERLRVVDLPGYGYARASKADIARWTKLTRAFLRGRAPLRRVFVLIDSRHGLKESDIELMDMLDEAAVTYQLILTKVDKLKKGELVKVLKRTSKRIKKRPAAFPTVISTSSSKKNGLDDLRAEIATLAETR